MSSPVLASINGVEKQDSASDFTPERTYHDFSPKTLSEATVKPKLPENEEEMRETGNNSDADKKGEVTLLTGHTVEIFEKNGERIYKIDGRQNTVHKLETDRGTYVFPEGVDFDKFDRDLFNVELLLKQGYNDSLVDTLPIIVELKEGLRTTSRYSKALESSIKGFGIERELGLIRSFSGKIPKKDAGKAFKDLRTEESIEKVHLDQKYRVALNDSVEAIAGEQARRKYGVDGDNITVAVLDTGIDDEHPDLDEGKVVLEKDFTGEGTVEDRYGHGTHVAGIIAGDGDASNGKYTGVAPNASLINARVLGTRGYGTTSGIIKGIEYSVNNSADIISMSLGGSVGTENPLVKASNRATEKGSVVSIAAGNSGRSGRYTIGSPGIAKKAITVGAINDDKMNVTDFSSKGPTLKKSFVKPDVVAPGYQVVSARAQKTRLGKKIGDSYTTASGTSMATPHVSGAAALILDQHPNWSPEKIKSALVNTADRLKNQGDVYVQGSGLINVTEGVNTDLIFNNATIDFGGITNTGKTSRTVTVTNVGSETQNLKIEANARKINSDKKASIDTNVSEITLNAGERAAIEIVVNIEKSKGKNAGVYSGSLTINNGDEEYSAPLGYTKKHKVTVKKDGISGTSVENDSLLMYQRERGVGKIKSFNDNGKIVFKGLGNYSLYTGGVDESTGETVLLGKSIEVNDRTQVSFYERKTEKYRIDVSKLKEDSGKLVNLSVQSSIRSIVEWSTTKNFADNRAIRISEGTLSNVGMSYLMVPEDQRSAKEEKIKLTSPKIYYLQYSGEEFGKSNVINVKSDSLETRGYNYYRGSGDENYGLIINTNETDAPVNEWKIGSLQQHKFVTNSYTSAFSWINIEEKRKLTPYGVSTPIYKSSSGVEAVNRQPYISDFTVIVYDETPTYRNLSVSGYFQRDSSGNVYNDYAVNGTVVIEKNGEQVDKISSNRSYVGKVVDISIPNGTKIEVTSIGRNPNGTLSTNTTVKYTMVKDKRIYESPGIRSVQVEGLNYNNTVSTGEITLHLMLVNTIKHYDPYQTSVIEDVKVSYSTGNGWQNATVQEIKEKDVSGRHNRYSYYTATFEINNKTKPSIRVHAIDNTSNSVNLTVENAFKVNPNAETPNIEAVNYTVNKKGIKAGEKLVVKASVKNKADITDLSSASLYVDGEHADTDGVWLRGSEAGTVRLETEIDKKGKHEIRVDDLEPTTVKVTRMSIKQAIAGDDERIGFNDIQKAIQYWVNDEKVPGTGKEIDFEILQSLIRVWADGGEI